MHTFPISYIAGWVGMALVLIAYYLVSTNRASGQSALYQWLNLVGAIGIAWNTFDLHAWPSMYLNLIWATIALLTLRTFKK